MVTFCSRIEFMSFDTTYSNTGKNLGATVFLEKLMNRRLIGLPCRHHIYEILIGKAFDVLKFETSQAPDVMMFKTFRQQWTTLDRNKFSSCIQNEFFKKSITETERQRLIEWIDHQLAQKQPKDDYMEILQLSKLFLGGDSITAIRAPGAVHKARWMAKILYCLKMYLFRDQLKLKKVLLGKLIRFNVFVVKLYLKCWFTSPCAAMAPQVDLNFLKSLKNYQQIDKDISNAVLNGFKNHLQYLESNLIALSIFDDNVSIIDKRKNVDKFNNIGKSFKLKIK